MNVYIEEANRCFEKAQKSLRAGDKATGKRLLKKSMKLYPSRKAKDLLVKLRASKKRKRSSSKTSRKRRAPSKTAGKAGSNKRQQRKKAKPQNPKKRKKARETKKSEQGSSAKSKETPVKAPELTSSATTCPEVPQGQINAVRRILAAQNFYERLGVKRNVKEAELKTAYKKLALSLHPDKNKAPDAEDAFKALGAAYNTLTDAGARRKYDATLYGSNCPKQDSAMPQKRTYTGEFKNQGGTQNKSSAKETGGGYFQRESGSGGSSQGQPQPKRPRTATHFHWEKSYTIRVDFNDFVRQVAKAFFEPCWFKYLPFGKQYS